ncbi:MAG TPA: hypothetical protein VGK73_19200 [Polyangiaceae bacterium]
MSHSARFSTYASKTSLLGAAVALLASACAGIPDSPVDPNDPEDDSCSSDADCDDGSVCEDGRCVVRQDPSECKSDADCSGGKRCIVGTCSAVLPKPGPTPPGPEEVCAKGELELVARPATVSVLVDQSFSMLQRFDGGTRWDVLRDALLDPESGVIKQLEQDIRFGIALYSSENGYGRAHTRACPLLTGLDEVPVALGNYDAISAIYGSARPIDDTPTAESLAAVTDKLAALANEGPKAIVLATDGEPDTCDDPDAHDPDTNAFAVATAEASYAAGVRTYILSVGTEIAEHHLQAMANAGAGVPAGGPNAPFFRATDQAGLESALSSIVTDIRTCTFHLEGDIDTAVVTKGKVLLDGELLEYGIDFTLDADGEVELLGARCTAMKTGDHTLSAEFPCVRNGVPIVR